jgi:DNA-directed RNA polymerase sigma subunit (sigma70/sigma32)
VIWEGVWIALPKFDPEAGAKFSTYAHFWMRHQAQEWMSKNSRILPLPRTSWALGLRIEEAFYEIHPYADIAEASDETLAALVVVNPKDTTQTRTVPHAGAILRAKRNGTEYDPTQNEEQDKPTETMEEYIFEEGHDTDMDAIDTMNAMTELATSRDPRAEEEGLALAFAFVDRHDLPDEVAERMMEEAGL